MLLDLVLVTPPTAELVTVEQLKAHLDIESEDHDLELADVLAEATAALDGYSGTLGRALAQQTWRLYLDAFPRDHIRLPLPPLISVDAVAYTDPDGAAQALTVATDCLVLAGERAELHPAWDKSWPSTRAIPRAVAVTFTCGWAAPAAEQPWAHKLQPVISALKLMAADLFQGSDPKTVETVRRLLNPLKIPRT